VRSVERQGFELQSRIYVLGPDSTLPRVLTRPANVSVSDPAWSPDGRQIAFARWLGEDQRYETEIVVVPVDGGSERVVWRQRRDDRGSGVGLPVWSPDGARIAFTRSRLDRSFHFRFSLLLVDAAGGQPRLLARDAGDAAWSPDGARIAFASTRDRNGEWCGSDECFYNGELYVMNSDGTNPVRLTHNRGDDSSPSWSPDGRRIAFASNRNNRDDPPGLDTEIYTIGADGTCLTWLTNGAPLSSDPAWRGTAAAPPESAACGAVPRAPRTEVALPGPPPRPGDPAVWLGERHGTLLLSHAELSRDRRSGRGYFFAYDDCARFRVRECPRGIQLQAASVCSPRSILAGFDRPNRLRLGPSFVRRGVLYVDLGLARVSVIAGRASVTMYAGSGPGSARAQLMAAGSALRPFGRRVRALPPPSIPGAVLERTRRTQRTYRRLGTIAGTALALNVTPEQIRRRLRLARAIDALPRVRTARCD
jgi:WD40-like Beta Propeller Repeat